jgi:hypothetical protein
MATIRGEAALNAALERGEIAPTDDPKVFRLARTEPVRRPQQNLRGHRGKR